MPSSTRKNPLTEKPVKAAAYGSFFTRECRESFFYQFSMGHSAPEVPNSDRGAVCR